MLGHGVELSGQGQRPVANTADRSACSVGGINRQQTTPVRVSIQLSRCDASRWWNLMNRWVGHGGGRGRRVGNKNVSHRNGSRMHTLYTFNQTLTE